MDTNNRGWRSLPARLRSEFQGTFRSLENPKFKLYFGGQLISVCGTWMQSTALSWLVYKITDSALALGIVAFAGLLPVLLFSYFAGGVADKFDRKRTILITQSLALTEAVVLTVLTALNLLSVPILVALAFFLGMCTAFEIPSRQAFVADIAKDGELVNAVGLNSALVNVCRMAGPVLAGLLVGFAGETWCFALNALSYVPALISLRAITVERKEKKAADPGAVKLSLWDMIKQMGMVEVFLLTAVVSIFGFQYQMLMPVIVDKVLHGGSSQYAFMSAMSGAGALIGSLALASKGKSETLRKLLGLAMLTLCVGLVAVSLSSTLIVSGIAVAAAGACLSVFFVGGNSLVQTVIPQGMRGRVLGIYNVALLGVAPLGSLLGGWTAQNFGVSRAVLIAAGACFVAACIYLWRLRSRGFDGGGTAGGPGSK